MISVKSFTCLFIYLLIVNSRVLLNNIFEICSKITKRHLFIKIINYNLYEIKKKF